MPDRSVGDAVNLCAVNVSDGVSFSGAPVRSAYRSRSGNRLLRKLRQPTVSAAVGPMAISTGIVNVPANGEAAVRIWQANIRNPSVSYVPMRNGEVVHRLVHGNLAEQIINVEAGPFATSTGQRLCSCTT